MKQRILIGLTILAWTGLCLGIAFSFQPEAHEQAPVLVHQAAYDALLAGHGKLGETGFPGLYGPGDLADLATMDTESLENLLQRAHDSDYPGLTLVLLAEWLALRAPADPQPAVADILQSHSAAAWCLDSAALPEQRILAGSALTRMALYSEDNFQRLYLVDDGCRILDATVEAHPRQASLRLFRAWNALGLPAFFGRQQVAEKDVIILEDLLATGADSGVTRPDLEKIRLALASAGGQP